MLVAKILYMAESSLDPMDVKILRFLSDDARIPYSHIARSLNISDVAVKKRVEKLVQRGIIKGFRVSVDFRKIGYKYVAFFEIKPDPSYANDVFSKISRLPNVLETYMLVGDYPIVAKAVLPTTDDIRNLSTVIGRMDGVLDMKTSIALDYVEKPLDISQKLSQRSLGGAQ